MHTKNTKQKESIYKKSYNYGLSPIAEKKYLYYEQSKNNFATVFATLFSCRSFYHGIKNSESEKNIIKYLKDTVTKIESSQEGKKINLNQITKEIMDSKYWKDASLVEKYHGLDSAPAIIINTLSQMLDNSSLSKLFGLSRIEYGYCNSCDNTGPQKHIKLPIYKLPRQLSFKEYDLEDHLYAERVSRKEPYVCTTCNTSYNYKILLTTNAPEIIIIQSRFNYSKKRLDALVSRELTIPCNKKMSFVYSLTAFISSISRNNLKNTDTEYYTNIVFGNNILTRDIHGETAELSHNHIVFLLFYSKVATIPTFTSGFL